MSEPIKVGDLVMVVKPSVCCKSVASIGRIFKVIAIGGKELMPLPWCNGCGQEAPPERTYVQVMAFGNCVDMVRLKRIDPPAIGDSLPTRKTIKEPA